MKSTSIATVIGGDTDRDDAPVSWRDRRFRRQFTRALRTLERKGRITAKERHRYRLATYNTFPIALEGQTGSFVGLLREGVEKEMKAAGDWIDDVRALLARMVAWIVENWEVVLRLLLSLLVFLESPECTQ